MTRHLNPDELAQFALEGTAAQDLVDHLYECSRCRGEVRDMERALASLSRLSQEHTPPARRGFVWPVEEPARKAPWWRGWRLAAPSLAGALALVAALWVGWGAQPGGAPTAGLMARTAAVDTDSQAEAVQSEATLWDDSSAGESDSGFTAFVVAQSASTPVGAREDFWEFVAPVATSQEEEGQWQMGTM